MNLRKAVALLALGLAAALLLCSFGAPVSYTLWQRGTTATGTSLSGSEPATDTIATSSVDCLMADKIYWTVRGDSVTPAARCSLVTVQVSMDGTNWVAAGGEFDKIDSLATRDINAQPRWVLLSRITTIDVPGIPWKQARLLLNFYGAHAKNLSNLYVAIRVY